jgi:membrane-associated phospholipid phosphatase
MQHKALLSFLFLLISTSSVSAQNRYNFSQFTRETGDFFTQPLKWRGNDWLKLGVITGGTALLMSIDQPIRDAVMQGDRKYYHSLPIEAGRAWGEWYAPPIVAGAFGLHGWLADNSTSKKIAFELIQAVTYSEAITQTTKFILGRARPYENEGAFSYHPMNFSGVGFHSLPGGHNTEGWAMSTILSRNAHAPVLKILAYAPSVLTFVSRIYQDQHWTSDDFLGAAVGYVVGSWVVNLHENKESAVSVTTTYPLTVSVAFF